MKRYAMKLGIYFVFYAFFYIIWVEFDSYKHENSIPKWIITGTDIGITIMDGIMFNWIYKGFERSIRFMD
jgi:hypothetical protein